MKTKRCDRCKEKIKTLKEVIKIKNEKLCKKCYKENRDKRREELINNSPGLEKEILELDKKIKKEYSRKYTERKQKNKPDSKDYPKIKGSTRGKIKQQNKSESYLSFHESQILLKLLMSRGLDFEDAKETIQKTKEELSQTRIKLKQQNKSEEDIKLKQQKLLEELYNY